LAVTTPVPLFFNALLAPLTSPKAFTLTAGFGVFGFFMVLIPDDDAGFDTHFSPANLSTFACEIPFFLAAAWICLYVRAIYVLEDKFIM
jgi:hypothetical protein